jgi:hypothetical protein
VARTIPLRSGHDVVLPVPEMPGRWGKLVDEQWRDEEIRQFAGRLRPVYREDTPTVIVVTSCIPTGLIVDEMMSMEDFLAGSRGQVAEAIRIANGVVSVHVTCNAARQIDTFTKDFSDIGLAVERMLAAPSSAMPGFTPILFTNQTGTYKALVASWHRDIEAAFRKGYVSATGSDDVSDLNILTPNKAVVECAQREDDWLITDKFGGKDAVATRDAAANDHARKWFDYVTY